MRSAWNAVLATWFFLLISVGLLAASTASAPGVAGFVPGLLLLLTIAVSFLVLVRVIQAHVALQRAWTAHAVAVPEPGTPSADAPPPLAAPDSAPALCAAPSVAAIMPERSPSPAPGSPLLGRGALALGLVSFNPLMALCAIACGIIAIVSAVRQPARYGGVVAAVAGMLVAVAFPGAQLSILLVALGDAREAARVVVCRSNLQTLWSALEVYRVDHGSYPPSLEALVDAGYIEWTKLHCPLDARPDSARSYKYFRPDPRPGPTDIVASCTADGHGRWTPVLKGNSAVVSIGSDEWREWSAMWDALQRGGALLRDGPPPDDEIGDLLGGGWHGVMSGVAWRHAQPLAMLPRSLH